MRRRGVLPCFRVCSLLLLSVCLCHAVPCGAGCNNTGSSNVSALSASLLLLDAEREIIADELAILNSKRNDRVVVPDETDSEDEVTAPAGSKSRSASSDAVSPHLTAASTVEATAAPASAAVVDDLLLSIAAPEHHSAIDTYGRPLPDAAADGHDSPDPTRSADEAVDSDAVNSQPADATAAAAAPVGLTPEEVATKRRCVPCRVVTVRCCKWCHRSCVSVSLACCCWLVGWLVVVVVAAAVAVLAAAVSVIRVVCLDVSLVLRSHFLSLCIVGVQ